MGTCDDDLMPVMMITMITMPGPARSTTSNFKLMIHSFSNDADVNDTESHHQVNYDVTVTLSTPGEFDHYLTVSLRGVGGLGICNLKCQ